MKDRALKQIEVADLFGIRQPDISKMLCGDFRKFSVERLLRLLVALDQDVRLSSTHCDRSNAPALHVSRGGADDRFRRLAKPSHTTSQLNLPCLQ